jgi:hypothetical protein
MAESTTKQSPSTFVGTSKVVQTEYPVSWTGIDEAMAGKN